MNRILIFLWLLRWPFTWQDIRDAWHNTQGEYVPFAGLLLWLEDLGLRESFEYRWRRARRVPR